MRRATGWRLPGHTLQKWPCSSSNAAAVAAAHDARWRRRLHRRERRGWRRRRRTVVIVSSSSCCHEQLQGMATKDHGSCSSIAGLAWARQNQPILGNPSAKRDLPPNLGCPRAPNIIPHLEGIVWQSWEPAMACRKHTSAHAMAYTMGYRGGRVILKMAVCL